MNPVENIEKLLKKMNVIPDAQTDRQTLTDILRAQKENKTNDPAYGRKSIWRVIMNNRVTKFAAVAILIFAVLIGLNINEADLAWGQVVEQMNKYTKYKCRQRVVRENGPQMPAMIVYHLNLSQRRQEVEDGTIHIIDMRGQDAVTVELYPQQKKATVTKLLGFGPRKDPDIVDMVKRFEQASTERLGTKKKDGKILHGFRHQPNPYNDFTVWVDPDTKLPVEIELKHPQAGQTIFLDKFEFDFQLDPSAFSTEIPEGYEVETLLQDYRPAGSVKPSEMTARQLESELTHTAYAIDELPWIRKQITIKTTDPLGSKTIVYITGLQNEDGHTILIIQSDYYDQTRMVWIPQQQMVLETPGDTKLYTHPNGEIYAEHFLESFAAAAPQFTDSADAGKEKFTRMIVMPDGVVLGLCSDLEMNTEQLKELAEALVPINPD